MRRILALLVALLALSFTSAATAARRETPNPDREPVSSPAALAGGTLPPEMVYISGAKFRMGYDHAYGDERPVHAVTVKAFLLDRHEVMNRQFGEFVEATGYRTQAERDGNAWCFLEGADDFQPSPAPTGGTAKAPAHPSNIAWITRLYA